MAATHSPGFKSFGLPILTTGKSSCGSIFKSATSDWASEPTSFGRVFAFVVEQDFDIAHAGNHVGIGQDIAVFADDEAGTEIQSVAFSIFLRHVGHIGNKAFEELVKRIVVGKLAQVHAMVVIRCRGAFCRCCLNIDDGLPFVLHQLGEVGQQHTDFSVIGIGFYALDEFFVFVFAEKGADFVAT